MKSYKELAEEMSGYVVSRLCPHRSDMKCLCGEIVEKDTVKLFASLLKDHSTSLVRQLLEAVPEDTSHLMTQQPEERKRRSILTGEGWNSCRQALIAKAIQLGVVEKE